MTDSPDTMRWVRRGAVIALLVIGWVFIAWKNHFHVTAPLVFVCLGYLAVIATIYNLWRTGAAAVDSSEDEDDSTSAKPAGALGELEREKRTLLKAIKEAEFDREMDKLSQRDADEMIHGYRARAIEVIKEIDLLGLGAAGTVRDQILREVRARVQLDGKAAKRAGAEARSGKPDAKTDARPAGKPGAKAEAKPGAKAGAGDKAAAKQAAEQAAGGADRRDGAEAVAAATPDAPGDAAPDPAASTERAAPNVPRDEELDADSTTALEPRHDEPAKEATP
jgi:hypothetical protein